MFPIKLFFISFSLCLISAFAQRSESISNKLYQYYDSGRIKVVYELSNNQPNGEAKYYFESGRLRAVAAYIKGKKSGVEVEYFDYSTRKVKRRSFYTNGRRVNITTHYFEEGQVAAKVPYHYGKQEGIAEFYNKKGVRIKTVSWKNGMKNGHGKWTTP